MQPHTIAIQGEAGSFHDEVASLCYPDAPDRINADSFAAVFDAVKHDTAQVGICAIENSMAGSINQVYDLLLKHRFHIINEHYLKVTLCLLGLEGASIKNIEEIYSHPVALAQCSQYLDKHLPNAKRLEHYDTAGAAKLIAAHGQSTSAAIASPQAAKLHSLSVLSKSIEDNGNTYTRFIIFSKAPNDITPTNHAKTSLVLRTSHQPGALYHALGAFAQNAINLSKLQSRPVPEEPWSYMFYVDVEAGITEDKLQQALQTLDEQNCQYTILGSYPSGSKT